MYAFKLSILISSGNEVKSVAAVTIRNLPEEVHRALKLRALNHGNSTEAEIRAILEEAVSPNARAKVGSELVRFGKRFGWLDLDITRRDS